MRLLVPAAIVAWVALLYLPVLGYPFLSLDDDYGVATNPGIREFSWRTVRFLFFEDQRDFRYFPLAYLSFALDHALFGLAPGAFHRTNLLLHLANTALVYALVRTLTRDTIAAAVTSLLFGVHPLQVESVAWISSRKNVMFLFFFLLSIFAYLDYARRFATQRALSLVSLAGSVLLFFLSITAKTTAITLPAILLLIDVARASPLPRNPFAFAWRNLPSKLVYLPVIAFAWVMTSRMARTSPFRMDFEFAPLDEVVIAGHNLFFYVAKSLVPIRLGVFYPLPNDGNPQLPPHFYAFALLGLALFALCVWSWGRWRWIFFGTAWYLATVLPSAIQPMFFDDLPLLAADRYLYQSAIGLFLLAGVAGSTGWRLAAASRALRAALVVGGAGIVAVLSLLTVQQIALFRGVVPLYEQTVRHHPSDAIYYRLAIEYADADRMGSAFDALERADATPIQIEFLQLFGYRMRLSDLYRRKGEYDRAAAMLASAIDATPNAIEPANARTPLAYRYLASLYDEAGERAQADAARARAETASVDPRSYFESNWFAMAPDAALAFLERRVREAPADAVAWYYLGRGLQLDQQPERAAECLRRASELGFEP